MRTVAVVFFEGFAPLDAYGPIQAFNLSFEPDAVDPKKPNLTAPLYEVVSVGATKGIVNCGPTGTGPGTGVDYSFEILPAVDVVLVPGGLNTRTLVNDAKFIKSLSSLCRRTPIVTSVCTGAALLAKTSFLDGKMATTNKTAWKWVVEQGPAVNWICPPRWVDGVDSELLTGYMTSGGVSAGIDMALALIEKLNGRQVVENTQALMEYSWSEDPNDDPFAYLCPVASKYG